MPKVDVLTLEGDKKESRDLPPGVFDVTANPVVYAHAARYYRTRQRAGTASVMTRAEVRGSGRKLWAQKHTGRARHADAQAPQFRGGGRAHGPRRGRASIHFPHRLRRLALRAALSDKLRDGHLRLLSLAPIESPDTRLFQGFPKRAGLTAGRVLFVLDPDSRQAYLSIRNLPNVTVRRATSLTAYDVMASRSVVLTDKSVDLLSSRLTEAAHG